MVAPLPRCLRVAAGAILVVGLAAAVWIYLNAPTPAAGAGNPLEESKQYVRTLELYGGKANVLAVELREWFDSLWHGTRLAYTVACSSVLLAGAFWLGAAASETDA